MSAPKVQSVLVTGANGFVGSALLPELSSRGFDVGQLLRGKDYQDNLSIKSFCIDDLDDLVDLTEPLKDVDVVIHLAARVHLMADKHIDPLAEYRRVNVVSTMNLARQAASMGVKRFIFVSSVKVNGELTEEGVRFCADDNPAPQDPYGLSKLEAEIGLIKLSRETGMELVIVRPPLVYGPGVRANLLSAMTWLRWGVPLPLGAVGNRRSLVFLGNLVDLLIRVVDHPKAAGEIFLVSDDDDVSTERLLGCIAKLLGSRVWLISTPKSWLLFLFKLVGRRDLSDRLLMSLALDVDKTKELLAWTPPYSFEEGMRETVASYLESLKR